jgi:outer membrane receptor protein involved in Fe transport
VSTFRNRTDFENQQLIKAYANYFNYNRLLSTQFVGEHFFPDNNNKVILDYVLSYSSILRKMPDYKIATYGGDALQGTYTLATPTLFSGGTGRFFSNLDENIMSGGFNGLYSFKLNTLHQKIKIGTFYQKRTRIFDSRSFTYYDATNGRQTFSTPDKDLSKDNITVGKIFLVERTRRTNDYYEAISELFANYILLENSFLNNKIKAVYGIRSETFYQKLETKTLEKPDEKLPIAEQKQITDWLPSINFTYSLTDKSNIRMAGFKSLNRPEFREMAPFVFYNFDLNADIRGNQNLKRTEIYNYDLRFEHFPTANQLFSIGIFYKNIINPVEFAFDVTQVTQRTFAYVNENRAENYGVELEVRKNLDFYNTGTLFWKDLTIFGNLSLIKSEIKKNELSYSTIGRPLQGQSNYVLNTGLLYENDRLGWGMAISYNKIGRRIFLIGAPGANDFGIDVYENPRDVIDVQFSKSVKKFNFRLTLGDILRQDFIFYQDLNNDGKFNRSNDNIVFKQNNGFTCMFAVQYSF